MLLNIAFDYRIDVLLLLTILMTELDANVLVYIDYGI